jgi:hypothetical protein
MRKRVSFNVVYLCPSIFIYYFVDCERQAKCPEPLAHHASVKVRGEEELFAWRELRQEEEENTATENQQINLSPQNAQPCIAGPFSLPWAPTSA